MRSEQLSGWKTLTAIADGVLLTQSEKGHGDGDWLVTLAQAYDGNGARVFGVDYTWNVNGVRARQAPRCAWTPRHCNQASKNVGQTTHAISYPLRLSVN